MWNGYLSLGGNEVINVARTQAYVDAGYVPAGVNVQNCDACDTLPELLGEKPYASPLIDQAPWFESGNPDTWDFAGILPLEITGAEGSTRTATVNELITDGGSVSGVRYASRTVAVTALLIGKTTCSVEAGLAWLSQALGGSKCSGPRPSGGSACSGDEMCMLTCCPDEVADSPVPGRLATTELPVYNWTPTGGFYDGTTGEMEPNVRAPGTWENLATNPSFEVDTAGWTLSGTPGASMALTTEGWPSVWGSKSLKITQDAVGASIATVSTDPVAISRAYVNLSVRVGSSTLQTGQQVRARLRAVFNDPANTTASAYIDLNVKSYAVLRASIPKPAGATTVTVRVLMSDVGTDNPADVGAELYVDALVIDDATVRRPALYIDGDMTDSPGVTFSWLGTPHASASRLVTTAQPVSLTGPVIECIDDAVFNFGVTTSKGAVNVQPQALDLDGTVLYTGGWVRVNGTNPLVLIDVDQGWGDWVPRLNLDPATPLPFTIDPTLSHVLYRNVEECADQITRSFLDTTTISGPTLVERIESSCGEQIFRVEWTMVAGNPAAFGPIEHLATAVWAETARPQAPIAADYRLAYGVSASRVGGTVNDIDTLCATPVQPPVLSVFDPCCPGFLKPPSLPYIADSCFDRATTYERSWVQIPKDYAPEVEDGVLSITLTNDGHNKRGLRIRIYPDPLGNGYQGIEECDFCDEFFVTYIPANAVWRLDGDTRRVTTRPAGGAQAIVSSASVRGRNGGPFSYPVMQCNTGYLLVVDVPSQYVEDCGTDCKGDEQGSVWVDVTMRRSSL
jgi:hypothetical protein